MTEYTLNRLTSTQLADFATASATFLAVVIQSSVKLELYYTRGHFIEISYCAKERPGQSTQWRLYSANHYPDVPASTKYLSIYLTSFKLPVC